MKKFLITAIAFAFATTVYGASQDDYPDKTTPVAADKLTMVDSEDLNAAGKAKVKNLLLSSLTSYLQTALTFSDSLPTDGDDGDILQQVSGEWAAVTPSSISDNTSIVTGKVQTATDANAHTFTEAEYHGGSVLATGAGIYTLPTAAAGYSGCVEAGYGVTAIIQLLPASGDYIVHEGVRGTVATAIASSGAAGDKICYTSYNATDWYVSTFGTWEE